MTPDFNYKLEKVEGVVKKIGEKYFEQKGIFNFDLLDFLNKIEFKMQNYKK